MLTAATIAVQAAKNNHPAVERNESLKVMEVIPHSLSSTPFPEPARGGQRAPRRQLLLRSEGFASCSRARSYCSVGEGGAWLARFCKRASWFASICLSFDCWSAVSAWYSSLWMRVSATVS